MDGNHKFSLRKISIYLVEYMTSRFYYFKMFLEVSAQMQYSEQLNSILSGTPSSALPGSSATRTQSHAAGRGMVSAALVHLTELSG